VASLLLGLGVFLFSARLVLLLSRHVRTLAADWEFEQQRRIRLRNGSIFYRCTEPLIDELAASRWTELLRPQQLELPFSRGGVSLPWQPREYCACLLIEALLLLTAVLPATLLVTAPEALTVGIVFAAVYVRGGLSGPRQHAHARLQLLSRRLPFGIEQVALVMHAGGGFREALATVVGDMPEHPFGQEFGRVLEDFGRGRTLSESLSALDARLQLPEVRELVTAICNSQELGTPLAEIFVTLAEQLRLKKAQWAEAEAGRAQVQVQGPALVIMVACMVTVVAPFIFKMVSDTGGNYGMQHARSAD
jgi:Flp pilus assembly protein TadB